MFEPSQLGIMTEQYAIEYEAIACNYDWDPELIIIF